MPKIFLGFSTSGSAGVVALTSGVIGSDIFLSTTTAEAFSSTVSVSLIRGTVSLVGLSSRVGIGLVNNNGLSMTSVVGESAAAVSVPGDGVRGGSLTLAFLDG